MYINCFKRKRGRPTVDRRNPKAQNYLASRLHNRNVLSKFRDKGLIDDHQYQAGLNFQVLYQRYLITIGAPHLCHTNWETMGSKIDYKHHQFTGSQTDSQSRNDIKVKEIWFRVTSHLKVKLVNDYRVFTQCILDDIQPTHDMTRVSQPLIRIVQDGLNLLIG